MLPDLHEASVFEDIKKNGMEAAMKYYQARKNFLTLKMRNTFEKMPNKNAAISQIFFRNPGNHSNQTGRSPDSPKDEDLMLKISQKMGGLPAELQPVLKKCLGFLGCHDLNRESLQV